MRVPLSWLKEFVEIPVSLEELAERLTLAGLEVTSIERIGETWDRDKIFVGRIVRVDPHPNADRLTLPTVEYGASEPITVVTGAPNIRVGQSGMKVALALAGARLYDGHTEGHPLTVLKPSKIRGITSAGMVCSELELGISDDHEGIMELPADAPVGSPLVDYLGDAVLDIDLTPNLSRCLSIIGVAREVAAILDVPAHIPEPAMEATGAPIDGQIDLEIADPELCNRYSAALIKGVKIGPSPWWMQRRLRLAGMRPINNVVDITNYVMLEWGQPLHAFDYRRLRPRPGTLYPPAIIVRRACPGEVITTLDGVERQLTEDMLLITDGEGPIAIAGVMGGLESEVTSATTDVLLESANFDFINNRRTSKALNLLSEASIRFSRGIPASRTAPAARRAAQLMRELAGGEIAAGLADLYPIPQQKVVVPISSADVQRVIGIDLDTEQIVELLGRLEFASEVAGDTIYATVPDHRLDVSITADVLEEIARIYGYGNIPTTLMRDELPPQRRDVELELEEHVRDVLVGCGLQEVMTYSLTSLQVESKVLAADETLDPRLFVKLANPISSEREYLRRSLAASLLETAAMNLRHTVSVALFEISAVALPVEGETLPAQPRRLGLVMVGPRTPRTWDEPAGHPYDFFDLKGVIQTLVDRLGMPAPVWEPVSIMPFAPGRAARLLIGGREIGHIGELHPVVKERFELPADPVCLAEFDLELLLSEAHPVVRVQPVSRFPGIAEDLAIIVAEEVPAERVRQVIVKAGGPLLARVELFDIYRGDQIPAGKKSLTFSLFFQASDRTLTDQEVRTYHARIVRSLAHELEATLRM